MRYRKRDVVARSGPVLTQARTFTKLTFVAKPAADFDPDKAADAPTVLLVNEFSEGTCDPALFNVTSRSQM